jgi:geranylgeranyl pyrophosphate synthase
VIELNGFIKSVLQSNLETGLLLESLESILQTVGIDKVASFPFAQLPVWACQATGGELKQAWVVSAAWCLLHTAALLLDDVEDEELTGKFWPPMELAQAINAATALIFVAQLTLARLSLSEIDSDKLFALSQTFSRAILRVCSGQHMDLARDTITLEDYWRVAAAKSGTFFSLACRAGAMLGTEVPQLVDCYAEFGSNLGVLIQISDDFNGIWNPRGRNDLVIRSRTLPVVYALSVGSPEIQQRLAELLDRAPGSETALNEARKLIVNLGSLEYMIVQAEVYRSRAKAALPPSERDCPAHYQLVALLNRIMPISISAVGSSASRIADRL